MQWKLAQKLSPTLCIYVRTPYYCSLGLFFLQDLKRWNLFVALRWIIDGGCPQGCLIRRAPPESLTRLRRRVILPVHSSPLPNSLWCTMACPRSSPLFNHRRAIAISALLLAPMAFSSWCIVFSGLPDWDIDVFLFGCFCIHSLDGGGCIFLGSFLPVTGSSLQFRVVQGSRNHHSQVRARPRMSYPFLMYSLPWTRITGGRNFTQLDSPNSHGERALWGHPDSIRWALTLQSSALTIRPTLYPLLRYLFIVIFSLKKSFWNAKVFHFTSR